MEYRRGSTLLVSPLLLLALFLVGCPKRPATSAASAPAPAAPASPPAAPAMPSTPPSAAATPTTPSPSPAPAPAAPAPAAPTPPPPRPSEFMATPNLKDIHFDFDKYDIRPADAKVLDENAKWMKANQNDLILIEGHCDERGTNEYNLALGERRAKSAMNYLVTLGVQASRITTLSYGEERPLCSEKNEGCWAQNRRAHFLVKAQ